MLKSLRTPVVLMGHWLLWLSPLSTAWAQSDLGTITGSVSDQSGAVIVGVSISATNTATGVTSKMSTSRSRSCAW